MNKAQLASRIADKLGLTKKQGDDIVEALTETITDTLAVQEEVTIAGFGTFSSRIRASRMGVNPQNPSERIRVPAVLVPKFKAGKALKDSLKAAQKSMASHSKMKDDEQDEEDVYPPSSVPPGPPQDISMQSQVNRPHGEDSNPHIEE